MAQKYICVQTFIMMAYTLLVQSFIISEATEPMCSKFHYNEQLLEKMIRTEIKVERVNQEIKKSEDKITNTLETLQKDVRDNQTFAESIIKEQIDNLSKEKDTLKTELETLMNENKNQVSLATVTVADTVKQQDDHIARMSQTIEKLKEAVSTSSTPTPTILFKARDLADTSPSSNEQLIFKNNLFNIGEAYDNATGTFTATVSGVYLFSVQLCSNRNSSQSYAIIVDDSTVTTSAVGDMSFYICDSNDAMVHMKAGMRAWVKHLSGAGYRTETSPWISFSGLLVHK